MGTGHMHQGMKELNHAQSAAGLEPLTLPGHEMWWHGGSTGRASSMTGVQIPSGAQENEFF